MTIKSIKTGWTGISALAGNEADTGAYESIATVSVGGTPQSSIEFTNIPSTFQHLQLRGIVRTNRGAATDYLVCQFNGDTGANYKGHSLYGNGTSAFSEAPNAIELGSCPANNELSNTFGTLVIDILDYSNTNKFTTLRALSGLDTNGSSQWVGLISGQWRNTAAVSSIKILSGLSSSLVQYSQIALYGIR